MLNYATDVYTEFMVKRKRSPQNIALIIAALVFGVLIIYFTGPILFTYFGPSSGSMLFFLVIAVAYGIYYLNSIQNLEFEYAFTNGDLTIDKIVNRKSRKRLTSFDCKEIQEMGDYAQNINKLAEKKFENKFFCSINEDGADAMYIAVKCRKTGYTLLVFDPSEKMLDAITNAIPRHLRNTIIK